MNSEKVERAETILKQLGGAGRVRAMTGAKRFVATDTGLMFDFANRAAGKPNHVRIDLNGNDEYEVSFYRTRGFNMKLVEEVTGLHAEDLIRIFEEQTGLYLRLGTVMLGGAR